MLHIVYYLLHCKKNAVSCQFGNSQHGCLHSDLIRQLPYSILYRLFSAKYLLCPGHLLLSGCGHIFEGIGDTELFPLIHTEGMIGQHLDALHIAERVDKGPETVQLILIVGDARDKHVADPHRHAQFREAAGTVEDVLVAMAGELPVRLTVDMLQVK